MMKRRITDELYRKLGCPDLGHKMYFMRDGKRIWGTVSMVAYNGFRGSKGHVQLGLEPFKRQK